MAANFDKATRLELERRAWELRVQGRTGDEVAAALGTTRSTVTRMLNRIERRLSERFARRVAQLRARQTAQLEYIQSQAMTAWERSKRDGETIKAIESGRFGDSTETTLVGQCGDPRLLEQARGAMADVRKIWGADTKPGADKDSRSLGQMIDDAERARENSVADARPR